MDNLIFNASFVNQDDPDFRIEGTAQLVAKRQFYSSRYFKGMVPLMQLMVTHRHCMPFLGHFLAHMDSNNLCRIASAKKLADQFGCHKQTLYEYIRELIDLSVLRRKGRLYMLNPAYACKTSPKLQKALIDLWSKYEFPALEAKSDEDDLPDYASGIIETIGG